MHTANQKLSINRFLRIMFRHCRHTAYSFSSIFTMFDTPIEVHNQVFALHCHAKKTKREIPNDLNVSMCSVHRIVKTWRESGSAKNKRKGRCGRKPKLSNRDKAVNCRETRICPSKTDQEISTASGATGPSVCLSTVQKTLKNVHLGRIDLLACLV